eukprot:s1140_g2.t1
MRASRRTTTWLTGGTQGTYLNSVLYTASAIRADNGIVSSPACLELIGGSTRVQAQGDLQLSASFRGGRAALRPGPGQLPAHRGDRAGNTGGNDGEVICNYGFQNLSDEKLKHNVEPAELEELQQLFDAVAWTRRSGSSSPSITTACAASCGECARGSKPAWRRWRRRGRGGVARDKGNGGGGALEFFRGLAEEFNVRDARKLYQIARRDHPERRDLTAARARAALRTDVARQAVTKALPDKRAETVSAAAREIIPELVEAETNYNEFNGLEGRYPSRPLAQEGEETDETVETLRQLEAGGSGGEETPETVETLRQLEAAGSGGEETPETVETLTQLEAAGSGGGGDETAETLRQLEAAGSGGGRDG